MRRFIVKNEGFECGHCHAKVPPSDTTCRNHCPFCLRSMHLDIFPGDRAAGCGGIMHPISYRLLAKMAISLEFRCEKCGYESSNKALRDHETVPDDYEKILEIP